MNKVYNQFANFTLPGEIQGAYNMGIGTRMFGPIKRAKLYYFIKDNKDNFTFNEMYDYYISLKPQRLQEESNNELKNRSIFQRIIEKYKPYFYDYSVYKNK